MLQSDIASPAALSNAIRIVRANLNDVTLRERGQVDENAMRFAALSEQGPWPDWISCGFECASCGELFELSAETYHGSGGTWRPVSQARK
jgi:hypothetical protein